MTNRVSLVIAVLNAADTLEACLQSILDQRHVDKEILVLDGESGDGTVEILKRWTDRLDYWVSEPDSGIYNAWNKGVRHASGDWICFLGADDRFAGSESLAQLVALGEREGAEFVSGRGRLVDAAGRHIKTFGGPWLPEKAGWGHAICHPGSLHKASLFQRFGPFSEQYRISADYEFMLRWDDSVRVVYSEEPVVLVGDAGICRKQKMLSIRETARIQAANLKGGRWLGLRYVLVEMGKYYGRRLLDVVTRVGH